MDVATWVLAVVTLVLAGATGWFAYDNHQVLKRMDREREDRISPVITLQLIAWDARLLKLRIQNVGTGAALEIKGKIQSIFIGDSSRSIDWSYPLLAPDKYEELPIPMPEDVPREKHFDWNSIRPVVDLIKADFEYKSISGLSYRRADTIKIQEVTQGWIDSRMLVTRDHPERLMPRIAKTLEDIAKALEKTGR
jgi:hypothetical protein